MTGNGPKPPTHPAAQSTSVSRAGAGNGVQPCAPVPLQTVV